MLSWLLILAVCPIRSVRESHNFFFRVGDRGEEDALLWRHKNKKVAGSVDIVKGLHHKHEQMGNPKVGLSVPSTTFSNGKQK